MPRGVSVERGWQIYRTPPGEARDPSDLGNQPAIVDAPVPGTVAQASVDTLPDGRDAREWDWWYINEFSLPGRKPLSGIRFEGLATLCEVFIDGERLINSANMFRRRQVALNGNRDSVSIALVFRAEASFLSAKRPRPTWKTNLVEHQQLRWLRTTLLGRMPSWAPCLPVIGPWRPVLLDQADHLLPETVRILATCDGSRGRVSVHVAGRFAGELPAVTFEVMGQCFECDVSGERDALTIECAAAVDLDPDDRWFPHTHGKARLHDYRIVAGDHVLATGKLGFREVRLDRSDNAVRLLVNDQPVFCRGACWTPDVARGRDAGAGTRETLATLKAAGANMIRIGGTMVYEDDEFFEVCDELGLMVWQDFMFANMDYPGDDEAFAVEVRQEVQAEVERLLAHPSMAVFCGNSEVEQQAAMFGVPAGGRENPVFYDLIPEVLAGAGSSLPYFPASPCEGDLPFHVGQGISHYFGVGAYRRPLSDLELARVRFASECLGFSNVPDDAGLVDAFGSALPVTHSPEWKAGVPRDNAAGWDFEDVRDHYIEELFDVDVRRLRYSDRERYLALSRAVTAELMKRAFLYWRSPESGCGGALIWHARDLVPGAGWGVLDSRGRPKPACHVLQHAWAPRVVALKDEGLDGMTATVLNETGETFSGELRVQLISGGRTIIAAATSPIEVEAFGSVRLPVDAMLGRFFDTGYVYQFGPEKHHVNAATLFDASGTAISTDCLFPSGYSLVALASADVDAEVTEQTDDTVVVTVTSADFLQFATVRARGWAFSDSNFHLLPGVPHRVVATRAVASAPALRASLTALNLSGTVTLK